MKLHVSSQAATQIAEAARWYESRQEELGGRFLDEVDAAIARIAEAPERWPLLPGAESKRARYVSVSGFPYVVIYRYDYEAVVVVSVSHTAQLR
jgi:plasmid stabilization system protein ParE